MVLPAQALDRIGDWQTSRDFVERRTAKRLLVTTAQLLDHLRPSSSNRICVTDRDERAYESFRIPFFFFTRDVRDLPRLVMCLQANWVALCMCV